jgi:hypothetical protein
MEKDVINTKYNINNIVLKHVEKFQSVVGIYIRFLGILEKNGEEYQSYKGTTEVRGKEFDIDFLTELKKQLSTLEQYLTYKKHFFFEVALLEINNDFLTKIPKYNVGRMGRSSDSTIREKACSNLDLLFFFV